MMAGQEIVISELNYKVGRLMELYIASRKQERALEVNVQQLQQQVRDLENETRRLNEEVKTLKVANAVSGREGSSEARACIGRLVREIDKCITLLHIAHE